MANVANTKNTGPASKDAVSGGKKFPLDKQGDIGGGYTLGTGSEEAHRTIMGMRIASTGFTGGELGKPKDTVSSMTKK